MKSEISVRRIKKTPPSLVRSWLAQHLAIPGHTHGTAVAELNEEFGTRTSHSRLNEWLRGDLQPDRRVRNHMLRCVIQRVLRQEGVEGLDDAQLDRIADNLS